MNRSFTKEAIIGPMAEATTFGLPSVIGYQFGKAEGRDLAKDRRASPKVLPHKNRPQRKKQVAAIALVPGSTGYLVGKKVGYKEELLESMAKWQEELKFHKVRKQSTKKYRNRVKFLMSNIKRNQQLLTKMVKDQKKQGILPPLKQKTGSVSETSMTSNINVATFKAMGDAFISIAAEEMVAVRNFSEEGKIASDRREVILTKLAEIRKEAMIKQASANGFIDELTKIAHATGDENLLKIAQSEMTKEAIFGLIGKGLGWAARAGTWAKGLPAATGRLAGGLKKGIGKWWKEPGLWQKRVAQPFKQGYGAVVNPGKLKATQKAGGGFATARASAGKSPVAAGKAGKADPKASYQGREGGTVRTKTRTSRPEVVVRGERGITGEALAPRLVTTGPARVTGRGGARAGPEVVTGSRGVTGASVDGVRIAPRTISPRPPHARGDAPLPTTGAAGSQAEALGNQASIAMGGSIGATPSQLAIAREAAGTGRVAAPAMQQSSKGSSAVRLRKGKGKKGPAKETTKTVDETAGGTKGTTGGTGGEGTKGLMPQGAKDWWAGLSPEARTAAKWGGGAGAAGLFLGSAMG